MEEYSKLLRSYKKSDDEISQEFRERINARLEEVAAQKRRKAKFIAFSKYATAATAAIFVIIFAVLFSRPVESETGEKISESIVVKGGPVTINLVYDAAEGRRRKRHAESRCNCRKYKFLSEFHFNTSFLYGI